MGLRKKRRHCSKIELVLPQKEEGKLKSSQKRDPMLERGWKSERTLIHGRHFPDLPGGEITIEGSSMVKHCTAATKKSPKIKMG